MCKMCSIESFHVQNVWISDAVRCGRFVMQKIRQWIHPECNLSSIFAAEEPTRGHLLFSYQTQRAGIQCSDEANYAILNVKSPLRCCRGNVIICRCKANDAYDGGA